jgi:hypothetical protein
MHTKVTYPVSMLLWGALLSISSCIDPYEPELQQGSPNLLVVDGFINTSGLTTIKLTRTQALQTSTELAVEARAKMYIEEENGQRFLLQEKPAGTYTSAPLALPTNKKYRVHFSTAAGQEYVSGYTPAKITPAIDKVTWQAKPDGVQVFVSTHDNASTSQYYRWDYEETWEFTSAFRSYFRLANGSMQRRLENIYRCWDTQKSGAIKLATTTRLSQDIVADYPLIHLPNNSIKLRYKYSVLFRQYAQTPEEFAYWDALRKNTESIGTLFDPLPTQLTGNVHAVTNPAELVMGYVGAYSVTEQRLFISENELPAGWQFQTGYEKCTQVDTVSAPDALFVFLDPNYLAIDFLGQKGYTALSTDCVDCRRRGTNVEPSFWK